MIKFKKKCCQYIIVSVILCFTFILTLTSCGGTQVASDNSEKFTELNKEVIEKTEAFTNDYLKTCELFPYYDFTNDSLYIEDGQTVYDAELFTPFGMIFELRSTEDEDFKGFILVSLKNYENGEGIKVERVEWQRGSPYKFVPEGMYLCYRHNGNYPEWLYTTRPNGGLLNLEDSEEYMAQFDGE